MKTRFTSAHCRRAAPGKCHGGGRALQPREAIAELPEAPHRNAEWLLGSFGRATKGRREPQEV
eukprot:11864950-Alexandrium_andersonii.AAC.1